ncbi:hypothetical protein PCASD_11481 [Puccinia coronata f. sp. avenae]|uniref:Uncharacterized protein n=1 Tax=Puccinia coronata f. sp. avenae TaxID=200324 RepID=A0A2N5V3B1_9BASI|nr:hypothetical protein PCASD_11481 [Puccinia coronata f. sp. avenae]
MSKLVFFVIEDESCDFVVDYDYFEDKVEAGDLIWVSGKLAVQEGHEVYNKL